jgi:hypothetical protein
VQLRVHVIFITGIFYSTAGTGETGVRLEDLCQLAHWVRGL